MLQSTTTRDSNNLDMQMVADRRLNNIIKLRGIHGFNKIGNPKESFIVTIPKPIASTLDLQEGDPFVVDVVKRSPITIRSRRLTVEGDNAWPCLIG